MKSFIILVVGLIIIVGGFFIYRSTNSFDLPEGETVVIEMSEASDAIQDENTEESSHDGDNTEAEIENATIETMKESFVLDRGPSKRTLLQTDDTKHSIPLSEILSGGPGKDGIPSIDEPEFITTDEADEFLRDDSAGLGLTIDGESRFYPYLILVWHEIVNDWFGENPVLVTYCPLCATGVVFDRHVDGEVREFGVSGLLWQSNLLMYDRTGNEDTESLWSQVLGEAVVGPQTGERLGIISSDTVQYGAWKKAHPDTRVLSRDTGAVRRYGTDPYGDYYIDNSAVSFGATFTDNRLPAKAFVLGVERNGQFKAYEARTLPEGVTKDLFAGEELTITKDSTGTVRIMAGDDEVSYIGGFWFSWVAVHPETEVFIN